MNRFKRLGALAKVSVVDWLSGDGDPLSSANLMAPGPSVPAVLFEEQ